MPLPYRKPRDPRKLVRAAVIVGVLAFGGLGALVAVRSITGDRPEEDVAEEFLDEFFTGNGARLHPRTTPEYRAIVFAEELGELSRAAATVVGADVDVRIVGSERTPGSRPLESFVGYTGTSVVGEVNGVVTLVELTPDEWFVRDVSYRFPQAPPGATAPLDDLTLELNERLVERVGGGTTATPPPAPTPVPTS